MIGRRKEGRGVGLAMLRVAVKVSCQMKRTTAGRGGGRGGEEGRKQGSKERKQRKGRKNEWKEWKT